jgi:hypothetical protein
MSSTNDDDNNNNNNNTGSGGNTGGVKLHPWIRPKPLLVQHDARLKMLNSLTREKEHFLTIDGSNHVTWYM